MQQASEIVRRRSGTLEMIYIRMYVRKGTLRTTDDASSLKQSKGIQTQLQTVHIVLLPSQNMV
jgi:hypothetical protein